MSDYDHRGEVQWHRRLAASLRKDAAKVRADAEHTAAEMEHKADCADEQADGIHRLCTAGSRAMCCKKAVRASQPEGRK